MTPFASVGLSLCLHTYLQCSDCMPLADMKVVATQMIEVEYKNETKRFAPEEVGYQSSWFV